MIYHLVVADDWPGWPEAGWREYAPASLAREGFIHFSTADQVSATALRYYADVERLLLVEVDAARLDPELLRWEDLSGHGAFPHLYGPLPAQAVNSVRRYRPGDEVS